jgi:hypothetical protein
MTNSKPATIEDFSNTSSHSELLNTRYASMKVVKVAINLQVMAFKILRKWDSLLISDMSYNFPIIIFKKGNFGKNKSNFDK